MSQLVANIQVGCYNCSCPDAELDNWKFLLWRQQNVGPRGPWSPCTRCCSWVGCLTHIQGRRHLWGQRFSELCFEICIPSLSPPLPSGVQISKQNTHRSLYQINNLTPVLPNFPTNVTPDISPATRVADRARASVCKAGSSQSGRPLSGHLGVD